MQSSIQNARCLVFFQKIDFIFKVCFQAAVVTGHCLAITGLWQSVTQFLCQLPPEEQGQSRRYFQILTISKLYPSGTEATNDAWTPHFRHLPSSGISININSFIKRINITNTQAY